MISSLVTVTWLLGTIKDTSKNEIQETSAYCALFRKKRGHYVGSTAVPTSSSLKMI